MMSMTDTENIDRALQTAILLGSGARREWAIRVWTRLGYPKFWA